MTKTNVMRLLDAAGIDYEAGEYEVDEDDLSGSHAADMMGMDHDTMFKTLVLKGDKNGYLVCCIPVDEELDLKKVAFLPKAVLRVFTTCDVETAKILIFSFSSRPISVSPTHLRSGTHLTIRLSDSFFDQNRPRHIVKLRQARVVQVHFQRIHQAVPLIEARLHPVRTE